MRRRILIVDDEPGIIKFLQVNLENRGFEVLAAMDGVEALKIIERRAPNLVILDILMPKMNGYELCRHVRGWSKVPIIMLSACRDESDKVRCLELGSDDYICKPFGVDELVARINAVLRRTMVPGTVKDKTSFTAGNFTMDFASRTVTIANVEVSLTPTEYNLLLELVLNAGKVLTHSYLLNKIWGPEYFEREYLRVFINRLRSKLTSPNFKYIMTIPAIGYRFQLIPKAK